MSALSGLFAAASATADADTALDAVFARTKVDPQVQPTPKPAQPAVPAAPAVRPPEDIITAARLAKRKKAGSSSSSTTTTAKASSSYAAASAEGQLDGHGHGHGHGQRRSKKQKQDPADKRSNGKALKRQQEEAEGSDDDDAVEAGYAARKAAQSAEKGNGKGKGKAGSVRAEERGGDKQAEPDEDDNDDIDDVDSSIDSDIDPTKLVHEADLHRHKKASNGVKAGADPKDRRQQKSKKAKGSAHAGETPAAKDARTTFLGNVPVSCATDKSARKALVRHLVAALPADHQAEIRLDSIRFRSLPFSAPVPEASGTRQPAGSTSSAASASASASAGDAAPVKAGENHSSRRARRWKDREHDDEPDADDAAGRARAKDPEFLTANQKRRVAFIKGEVHEKAKSCNAYAVWTCATRQPQPPPGAVASSAASAQWTAQQLAALVVQYANNTVFQGHTLRVDRASAKGASAVDKGSDSATAGIDGEGHEAAPMTGRARLEAAAAEQKAKQEEERRTLYVGSLDFEETDQQLRDLCERLMREEKGEASPAPDGAGARAQWVERVRVVKDGETGLGKGFAYVIFRDRECVDEMLALDAQRVRLSKRKLRLERCKSLSAAAAAKKAAEAASARAAAAEARERARKDKRSADAAARRAAPRIDLSELPAPRPDIGESLRELSKEDRKALKESDAERAARRLEKKSRARLTMKMEKQKEVLDKRLKLAGKGGSAESKKFKAGKNDGGKSKKTRTRSDAMIKKKNTKKAIA